MVKLTKVMKNLGVKIFTCAKKDKEKAKPFGKSLAFEILNFTSPLLF